ASYYLSATCNGTMEHSDGSQRGASRRAGTVTAGQSEASTTTKRFGTLSEARHGGYPVTVNRYGVWPLHSCDAVPACRRHLAVNENCGFVEAGHHQKRRCGANISERFAANRKNGICILRIRYVVDRSNNVRHCKAIIAQNFLNGRKTIARLGGHLGRHRHGFIIVARCSRDECKITIDDRTAVTGKSFEW